MSKFFTLSVIVFYLFLSEISYSQSNKINEIKSSKQLINGINLSPNLQKATPTTITTNELNNIVVSPKPEKETKPIKSLKYNNNKLKRDEE